MKNVAYFNYHNSLVAIHRNDDPVDVDEAWGEGTYRSLFPLFPLVEDDGTLGSEEKSE